MKQDIEHKQPKDAKENSRSFVENKCKYDGLWNEIRKDYGNTHKSNGRNFIVYEPTNDKSIIINGIKFIVE